jgi:ring-1,2-phenylacetyl-CoA epoxidase subunit PaaE
LVYANLNEESVVFQKELDEIEGQNKERLKIYHVFDKPKNDHEKLFTGIMTSEKTTEIITAMKMLDSVSEYFICGPPGMKEGVVNSLHSLNIEDNKINIEVFTIDESREDRATEDSGDEMVIESAATLVLDGEEFELTVLPENTVLQTGLDEGLDLPYSCKGGMCMTCRAKLLEGSVKMTLNYALTEAEVEQGYILTCQSHPTTATVIVDYDQGL